MATAAQKAIIKAKINDVITELIVKSHGDMVYIGSGDSAVTLSSKLAEIIAAIEKKADETASQFRLQTAINNLRSELMGGTDVAEAYDTFKELAQYVEEHADVVETLNAAIGAKADQSTVDDILATINGLGALAKLNKITTAEFTDGLKNEFEGLVAAKHGHTNKTVLDGITSTKVSNWDTAFTNNHTHSNKSVLDSINAADVTNWNAAMSHVHSHDNKSVLDGITADDVTDLRAQAKVYYSESEPANLRAQDLWFQLQGSITV